jgi:hypothetical protein
MQNFKGDDTELKFINSAGPVLDSLSLQKTQFFQGAYTCGPLGDLIYNTKRAPLSTAVVQSIFRTAFSQMFAAFITAGTFESYITVFKKIFGDNVGIVFTVPAPGQLTIALSATTLELNDLTMRYVDTVANAYVYDTLVDYDGTSIQVQSVTGFQSQYELQSMLFELVPAGIFTSISLTFGGS